MKINAGCGDYLADGWLNLDSNNPKADRRWDVTKGLPKGKEPIERIYAGHVLEHLPHGDVAAVLRRWLDHPSVGPDTRLAVVGPDCDRGRAWVADGRMTAEEFTSLDKTEVDGYYEGSPHLWAATEAETVELVRAGGWTPAVVTLEELHADGWPVTSLIGWQFALLCTPA